MVKASGEDEIAGRGPMPGRYRRRNPPWRDDGVLPPLVVRGGLERRAEFARPVAEGPVRRAPRDPARTDPAGPVGVVRAQASDPEQAPVEVRLDRPTGWAQDRARRERCGLPRAVRSRTRPDRALEGLEETGPRRPHGRVTGADERGRSSRSR